MASCAIMKGCFVDDRNKELYSIYLNYRRAGESHETSISHAIATPCSRYWVSHIYLYRVFLDSRNKNNKGTNRISCRANRRELEKKIFKDYDELAKHAEFRGCSFYFMVCFLINRPAPQFYLSYRSARRIICEMRRKYAFNHRFVRKYKTDKEEL